MDIKRIIALAAAAAMLGASAVTVSAEAGDDLLLTGGGAESGARGDGSPNYWTMDDPDVIYCNDSVYVHSGNGSVKVTNATGGKDGGNAGPYFDTQPTVGETYEITAYIYALADGKYSISPLSGYWDTVNGVITEDCRAGEWTEISGRITISEWKNGMLVIWPEQATDTFYIDDVSMVEVEDASITDYNSLKSALTVSGKGAVENSFTADEESISMPSGVTSYITGSGNTITRNVGSNDSGALIRFTDNTTASLSISDVKFAGKGVFLKMESTAAHVTLNNVDFTDSSGDNYSAIYSQNVTLTLNNVTFPDRETGYDLTSEWGCGTIYLTGATKLSMQKEAQHYSLHVTGLTKGADVKIAFTGADGDASDIPYNAVVAQKDQLSPDLEMICDPEAKTVHIITKTEQPEEPDYEAGFKFSEEISLEELNGKKLYLTRGDGRTATLETETYTSGLGNAIVGIIIENIPSDVTITSVELR